MESVQTKGDAILNEVVKNHKWKYEFQALYYKGSVAFWPVFFKQFDYFFTFGLLLKLKQSW